MVLCLNMSQINHLPPKDHHSAHHRGRRDPYNNLLTPNLVSMLNTLVPKEHNPEIIHISEMCPKLYSSPWNELK